MAKNKSMRNVEGEMKSDEQQKNEEGNLTVVLEVDFHCEGCVLKVLKTVRSFEGVEKVTYDSDGNKLTVIGKVDPLKLKVKLERKSSKSVQLISPLPKDCKKENQNDNDSKGDDKKTKEKESPVATAVLKLHLHCEGCIEKIHKIITKNKGYKEMEIDREKDLVTVTGSMDMKELVEALKKQLKKDVEIVPPRKEGGAKKKDEEKRKCKDGKGGGGSSSDKAMDTGMHNQHLQYEYPYMNMYPAIHVFSDENPNACSIM